MSEVKQYADRDIIDLDEKGDYYFRHVDAMTGESLHSKSDIAAELGHCDMLIDTYRDLCAELLEAINKKSIAENLNQHVEAMVELEWVIAKAKSILGESQ